MAGPGTSWRDDAEPAEPLIVGGPPTPVPLTTVTPRAGGPDPVALQIPDRLGYRLKRAVLGKPLVSASLHGEKLSKKAALGVLSSDCISSAAYGTEEMLLVLLLIFGFTGFHILLPMTVVVLVVLVLMTLSYREVVMVYTKAGGSYVVARDNFGPKIAQIASVALLIDYVVTVAVQGAAGTAAITSLIPGLSPYAIEITIAVVLLLAFGNLRGVREAGKAFALPTYLFVGMAGLVVVVGVFKVILGDLPVFSYHSGGPNPIMDINDGHHQILSAFAIFYLLQAFANGGSSLTGLEAISNGVSAFKNPRGLNARRTLSIMSVLLGFLVGGISYLAYRTHATPFKSGSPTVISQVAQAAFGGGLIGHAGFVAVQVATALILFTGANTPFTGFPFLANFIAEDSFLPRQLTRRGHRLAFSNGIIVLTVAALALLIGVGAHVDKLVPFYAIGVFTGFTMAGFGMAKYHHTRREQGWRRRLAINFTGGAVSGLIVIIFAVVKFTEGAWLVVILFPILWFALLRLNRQYRNEAHSLDLATSVELARPTARYPRHVVMLMVDRLDLAVLRARRYAGSLHPTEVVAVHINIDDDVAAKLQKAWIAANIGDDTPLRIVDCPDRRLIQAVAEQALTGVVGQHAEVTVLLPRRTFGRLSQRLLHDRTADKIAEAMGRIRHVSATIVPFDTTLPPAAAERLEQQRNQAATQLALTGRRNDGDHTKAPAAPAVKRPPSAGTPGVTPIGEVTWKDQVTIEGRVQAVTIGTLGGKALETQVFDDTGGIQLLFFGRTAISGLECGRLVRATGRVGEFKGHLALANPTYELLPPPGAPRH